MFEKSGEKVWRFESWQSLINFNEEAKEVTFHSISMFLPFWGEITDVVIIHFNQHHHLWVHNSLTVWDSGALH